MLTYADVSLHLRAASRIFLLAQHSCRQMRRRFPSSCQVSSYHYICGYMCVLILPYMRRRFPSSCQVSSYYCICGYICVLILLYMRLYMCPHTILYMRQRFPSSCQVSSYCYICVLMLLYMRLYVSSYYYMCGERLLCAASSCQARTNGWRLRQPTTSRAMASIPQVC
jgi:hypothetical protein